MKSLVKQFVTVTSKVSAFWLLYRICNKIAQFLSGVYAFACEARFRDAIVPVRPWIAAANSSRARVHALAEALSPGLVVANGPFKGMKYPSAEAAGSELLPKLLGSYESELHPVIGRLLTADYSEIVDVGCAEGYYAVGLGMRLPNARIYAFDTDPAARKMCHEMARLNGVSERLILGDLCNGSMLMSLNLGRKALIVSDCEGYEKTLFSEKVVEFLSGHDVLIETHDFGDIEVSELLRQRFGRTHNILAIDSVDDLRKVRTYRYPELEPYDAATRLIALAERRPAIMEWLFMTPKT